MFLGWRFWPSGIKGHQVDTFTILTSLNWLELELHTADSKFLINNLANISYYLGHVTLRNTQDFVKTKQT